MLNIGLKFFQVCGLYPLKIEKYESFEKHRNSFDSILQKVWAALHLSAALALILFVVIDNKNLLYGETAIGNFNDILVLFSVYIAHFSIILESFMKRKNFIKYWKYFAKINRVLKWHRKVVAKLFLPVLFSVLMELIVINSIGEDQQWTVFWYIQIYGLMITRIRFLQHIFFIDIIFYSLEDMNSRLQTFDKQTNAVGTDKKEECHKYLAEIKEEFKVLMKMTININKIFCWSQALNVGQIFLEATCDFFWIYVFTAGPSFLFG